MQPDLFLLNHLRNKSIRIMCIFSKVVDVQLHVIGCSLLPVSLFDTIEQGGNACCGRPTYLIFCLFACLLASWLGFAWLDLAACLLACKCACLLAFCWLVQLTSSLTSKKLGKTNKERESDSERSALVSVNGAGCNGHLSSWSGKTKTKR